MIAQASPETLAAAFSDVGDWVFDLDNTLYPAETGLFAQIIARIRAYVARVADLGPAEARLLQEDYCRRYGTTLSGLMAEYDVDTADYLADVHDIDRSAVRPDHRLDAALARLPGEKFVLTSGSVEHARRTMACLGITDRFSDIFDIVASDLVPKPHAETYDAFFARTGIAPRRSVMFEDVALNLEVPRERGMRTVLVVPKSRPESGEAVRSDFVTDDLAGFLETVADALEV